MAGGEEIDEGMEPLVSDASREAQALATAAVERLGRDSPAALLVCDAFLFRAFATDFVERCAAVEAVVQAPDAQRLADAVHALVLYTKGSDAHRRRALSGGGVDAVLRALRAHLHDAALAEHCCGALCNVTVHADARAAVADGGGCELLVAAMRAHPAAERLQKRCCGALAHVGRADAHKARVVAAGGVDAVLAAMRAHAAPAGSTETQARACAALHTLASGPLRVRRAVADAGAIGAVVAALGAHRLSHSTVEHGCGALCLLVAEPAMRRRLLSPPLAVAVARCAVLMPQSRYVRACFDAVMRIEHPLALRAREEGVCTRTYVPRCADGRCPAAKHCFCAECCVPQRAFACGQCDSDSSSTAGRQRFCEACLRRCHSGHTGIIEYFTPLSCDCDCTTNPPHPPPQQASLSSSVLKRPRSEEDNGGGIGEGEDDDDDDKKGPAAKRQAGASEPPPPDKCAIQ